MSDSVRPHRRQPTRLPRPWDSPGKNTGVDCHFLLQCMKVKSESEVTQSCPTLSDPMDCSLPGSSIHGIFQARVLEWGSITFSDWSIESSTNNSLGIFLIASAVTLWCGHSCGFCHQMDWVCVLSHTFSCMWPWPSYLTSLGLRFLNSFSVRIKWTNMWSTSNNACSTIEQVFSTVISTPFNWLSVLGCHRQNNGSWNLWILPHTAKRDFSDEIKLRILRWGDYPR